MQSLLTRWRVGMAAMLRGVILLIALFHSLTAQAVEPGEMQDMLVQSFEVSQYLIVGNTNLSETEIEAVVAPYKGPLMTTDEIERARDGLEKAYHDKGFPAVLVNIPEQTIDAGVVRLEVVESRIRRVRITGNRYFTMESIEKELPALASGKQLFVPQLQDELNRLNRNRNLKVAPVLLPGKEPGTIDVELKVKDRLPVHGSTEVNNRASHDTSSLRFNGSVRYENLWQKSHSLSLQYQTAPKKLHETQVVAGSYIFPSYWRDNDLTVIYAVASDSENAFGDGFQVLGKGNIYGIRQILQLPGLDDYNHNVTLGFDYKDFDETLGFDSGADAVATPISYMPFSVSYTSSLADAGGVTQFSGGLNLSFRGLVTDRREFEVKRYMARGNYFYATLGLERRQKLPVGFGLSLKLDGQLADQPLIANEQFSSGGMTSVRGYKESEEVGDNGLHAMLELGSPDLTELVRLPRVIDGMAPFLFYDVAYLTMLDPLPETSSYARLASTGLGARGRLDRNWTVETNWAYCIWSTDKTVSGETRTQFLVKFEF